MTSDYTLLKFTKVSEHLLESLSSSYLYFSHPDDLNDPFDCKVDVDRSLVNAIAQCTNAKIREALIELQGGKDLGHAKQLSRNCGVMSFCAEEEMPLNGSNSTLMWSHYAGNHMGVCLTYSFPESWFYDNSHEIVGTGLIEYGSNLLTSWFVGEHDSYFERLKENGKFDASIYLLVKLLTIKSECWRYEKEARIIKQSQGKFQISSALLRQVCFGLNTPRSDIEQIKEICRSGGYDVNFCKIERGREDFSLEIADLN